MRLARTCYDHLAGRLAVALADTLVERGCLEMGADGGDVTSAGLAFFDRAGVALPAASRRAYCRPCLDWSERRPHIAGAVGAAILAHALDKGWLRRRRGSRALDLTPFGRQGFAATFGVRLDA